MYIAPWDHRRDGLVFGHSFENRFKIRRPKRNACSKTKKNGRKGPFRVDQEFLTGLIRSYKIEPGKVVGKVDQLLLEPIPLMPHVGDVILADRYIVEDKVTESIGPCGP